MTEIEGEAYPGQPEPPTMLSCETDRSDGRFGDVVFQIKGDTDKLLQAHDLAKGNVRISFPMHSVDLEKKEIKVHKDNEHDVRVVYSGDDHRRLNSQMIGKKFVLVIRVSGYTNNGRDKRSVTQSAALLAEDIFDDFNNNAVSTAILPLHTDRRSLIHTCTTSDSSFHDFTAYVIFVLN